MSTAVFPGSFDPVTTGHVDLIRRASRMFDRLVVGVLVNSAKQPLFSKEERVAMLREITADQDNIEVSSFEGLLVDFVKEQHADAIVRGLRTPGDFEYELPLAQANHKLSVQAGYHISGICTGVFLYQLQCSQRAFKISGRYFRLCTGDGSSLYEGA